MKSLSDSTVVRARSAVQRGADKLGLVSVYTGFPSYPEAMLEFSEGPAPDFAPLLATCLDAVLFSALAHVFTHLHSPRHASTNAESMRCRLTSTRAKMSVGS